MLTGFQGAIFLASSRTTMTKSNGKYAENSHALILGLGSAGSRLIQKYKDEYSGIDELKNIRMESADSYVVGLDASEFDRVSLRRSLDGISTVLLVTCAGGKAGGAMALFTTLHALSENVFVHVVLSYPMAWEGGRRTKNAIALHHELIAMGVIPSTIDGDKIDDSNPDLDCDDLLALLDTAMLNEVRRCFAETRLKNSKAEINVKNRCSRTTV
jgi:hypothetical protein